LRRSNLIAHQQGIASHKTLAMTAVSEFNMKTINNFRDFGGYATTDGQRLRSGRLYRSGTLDNARGADLQAVQTLGLKTIVDLRAPKEKKKVLPVIAGARRIDLPLDPEPRTREKVQPLMTKRGAEGEVVEILKQMYRTLVDEAAAGGSIFHPRCRQRRC
jgi:protein tyrosine/serine phosphatase